MKEVNLERYKKEYLKNLEKLISFKSYLENINDYPTKEQIAALKFFINLGKEANFKTYLDPEGQYAYLEIGAGKELIGILGHIDVVGASNLTEWRSKPFKLLIKDQILYGRGVLDDKGPILLAFYNLKALLDQKIPLRKRFRLIIGTDEEVLWRGIKKYIEIEEHPKLGFTPDGIFPVIYAEKGLLQWYTEELVNLQEFKLVGGESINVVADRAAYQGKDYQKVLQALEEQQLDYKLGEDEEIIVEGKSAHAMVPESGKNALLQFVSILKDFTDSRLIKFIAEQIKLETNGITLFNRLISDQETGEITVNLGKFTIEPEGKLRAWFDIRIPVLGSNLEEIEQLLKIKLQKYQLEYHLFDFLKPIYADKNSDFIKLLMDSYDKYLPDGKKPYTLGGATYARAIENIFAFGPMLQEEENLEHEPNESLKISVLETAFKIYHDVLVKLNKL